MYDLVPPLGLFMLILFATKWPEDLSFKWKYVKQLLQIELILIIFRTSLFVLFPESIPDHFPNMTQMPLIYFLSVWWEDAVFVLPVILVSKYFKPTWITLIAILISSYFFASGHQYQGWFGVAVTALYVPVIYKYRNILGMGTVMVCHIMHDVMISLNFKVLYALLGLV